MRALVQRVSRAEVRVDGEVVAQIGPGLLVLLGVTHDDDAARADRLADKVRALRVFPDADGRMNEPLGEREVLVVSQFTLYGDTRKGNRPSYVAAAPGDVAEPLYERFRARLGAAGRRLRRRHGRRARQRRAGHAAARGLTAARPVVDCAPCPSSPVSFRASSPSPRRNRCPTAAGPATLERHFLGACDAIDADDEDLGEPGEIAFYPDRTWHGRTFVPATARTSNGLRAVRLRLLPPRDRGSRADGVRRRRRLHRGHRRGQPRLAARPLRRGRRHLARRGRQDRAHDARLGPPARRRRRDRHRRARRPDRRPVRARHGALHAAGARRLPRRHAGLQALRRARARRSRASRSTRTTARTTRTPDEDE